MAIAAHTLAMARHFAWEDLPNGDKRFVVSDFWWFCFSQTLVYAFIFIGIPMMQRYVRSPESSWSHLFDEADK